MTHASRKIVFLIVIFCIPLTAAFLLYRLDWRPQDTVNNGHLIQPPVPIAQIQNDLLNPESIAIFTGKWTLLSLYSDSRPCDSLCQLAYQQLHHIQVALGKDSHRVQRIVIFQNTQPLAEYEETLVPARDLEAIQRKLHTLTSFHGQDGVWLIDPLGNTMMFYSKQELDRGVLKDLERLMKYSHIG